MLKKLRYILFTLFIALPIVSTTFPASARNVTFTVKDSEGTLIGATVEIFTSDTNKISSITDTSGKTTLNVPNNATKIQVSYLGYEPYSNTNIPQTDTFTITLIPSATDLQALSVIACTTITNGIKEVECINCPDNNSCSQLKCSGECVAKTCIEPCYKKIDNKCVLQSIDGGVFSIKDKQCTLTCLSVAGYRQDPKNSWQCTNDCTSTITDLNVKHAKYRGAKTQGKMTCEITECQNKYHVSDDKTSCIPDQGDCSPDQLSAIHASSGYLITKENKCVPKKCLEPEYKKEGDGDNAVCISQVGKPCDAKNAKRAQYEMQDGKLVCVISDCNDGYGLNNNKCVRDCLTKIQATEPLATKAEYDNKMNCIIQKCGTKNGKKYIPSEDGKKCEESERDCDKNTDASIWPQHATAASYKKQKTNTTAKCIATECESGYEVENGNCVSVNDTNCSTKPDRAKKSHRYYDASSNETLCLIDECEEGYKPSNDKKSCILESALSKEDAQKRMEELQKNADEAKARERSWANRTLGAVGIGAGGVGAMEMLSGKAEQSADEDAERDMRAYLATFTCDFGQGRNIKGGDKNIELPGGNDLIAYVTEYKQLAAQLQADKAALNMRPGIEAEVVLDKSETGLYDNVGLGRQKGHFTSLARALMDPNSEDAAEWQAQKDATAQKIKKGTTIAAAGLAASAVGNIIVNHGKGDKSQSIMNKYKKQPVQDVSPERRPCPPGSKGQFIPNCECIEQNEYFNSNHGCTACDGEGQIVNADKSGCECDAENGWTMVVGAPQLTCQQQTQGCNLTGFVDTSTCTCLPGATEVENKCECNKPGYQQINDTTCQKCSLRGLVSKSDPCQCVDNAHTEGRFCTCNTGYTEQAGTCMQTTPTTPATHQFQAIVSSDSAFEPGQCDISDKCSEIITKIQKQLLAQPEITPDGNWLDTIKNSTITVTIHGHTDHQGFNLEKVKSNTCLNRINSQKKQDLNKELSKQRAISMKKCLQNNTRILFSSATVTYVPEENEMGKGEDDCAPSPYINPTCRKVDISIEIHSNIPN